MDQLHSGLADFSAYASTRKWQMLMGAAIGSFVVCHLVAQHTMPLPFGASSSPDSTLERQLLHGFAEILRFVLPYACLASAVSSYWRARRRTRA